MNSSSCAEQLGGTITSCQEQALACGADVYILLHREGRYYTYKSTYQPLPLEKITRTLEACFCVTYRIPKDMQDQS